jgi:hypothetical protein
MATILASVGAIPARNNRQDVVTVQTLLNAHVGRLGLSRVNVDGTCDGRTMTAIREFQKRIVGLKDPDGRVDPDGRTWKVLSEGSPAKVVESRLIRVTGLKLPLPAEKVLKEIIQAAGLTSARVTSVTRTPADQARIMYENIATHGIAYSYTLYGANGDKITKVYEDNQTKPKKDVIALMAEKISEVGPSRISKHCSTTYYVFDVAPSSIAARDAFVKAVNAHPAVSKLLQPPSDPAYHIEIPKNAVNL